MTNVQWKTSIVRHSHGYEDSFGQTVEFQRWCLNVGSEWHDVTAFGKLFHVRAAVVGKAQSLTVKRCVSDRMTVRVHASAYCASQTSLLGLSLVTSTQDQRQTKESTTSTLDQVQTWQMDCSAYTVIKTCNSSLVNI